MARILIAEDETGLRVAMAGWLAASGHRVIACEDGEKAWQELGSMAPERPDVLVLQECGDNSGHGSGSGLDSVTNLTTTLGLLLDGGTLATSVLASTWIPF